MTDDATNAFSPRRRREHERLLRRLSSIGAVTITEARSPAEVRDGLELFLALEASGWKAERGTALLCDTRDATFHRMMARALAADGRISVPLVEAGGRIAAAGIVLRSGGQGWFVKMTHDEGLRAMAPGAILTQAVADLAGGGGGESGGGDSGLDLIDSCAVAGHGLIERLWKGRMRVGDLIIQRADNRGRALARETAIRRVRALAKSAWYRLRGWQADSRIDLN
jgi:hypothetical protein